MARHDAGHDTRNLTMTTTSPTMQCPDCHVPAAIGYDYDRGQQVEFCPNWRVCGHHVGAPLARVANTAATPTRSVRTVPAPRFTCPRCGEHRDTTVRGHCDDCEG
jgi:hypothetical protein